MPATKVEFCKKKSSTQANSNTATTSRFHLPSTNHNSFCFFQTLDTSPDTPSITSEKSCTSSTTNPSSSTSNTPMTSSSSSESTLSSLLAHGVKLSTPGSNSLADMSLDEVILIGQNYIYWKPGQIWLIYSLTVLH